jgi:peptide/nickel transport system ATP-binding protein
MSAAGALLSVRDLSLEFRTRTGTVAALERVGFEIAPGETVGIVGESGSGKSVTAYALLGILDPAARILSGTAQFGETELLHASEAELQTLRGGRISMIFQNPRAALNPIRKIGRQIEDVLAAHRGAADLRARAIELLARVRIPDPERRYHAYPFELSGGMCQRVMIAAALACRPALLIADEPTTGLDVTTQAAIMDLLQDLGKDERMATLLITHDLGLAREYCDRIVVMHAGHVIESASTEDLFARPRHPYTARLVAATPSAGRALADLAPVPGNLPDLRRALPSCRYQRRCEHASAVCDGPLPHIAELPGHRVACHHPL